MEISDRIFARRTELNLSKVALAKSIGVSDVTVGKWESGVNQPKGRYLNDLADALGVSVDWLLTGTIRPPESVRALQIGERIRLRRTQLGLDPVSLSKSVGVSARMIDKWERGELVPLAEWLSQLLKVLDVNEAWLMDGTGLVTSGERSHLIANIEPASLPVGDLVPIINYVQAGHWREMCEQPTAFDGDVEYAMAGCEVGPNSFGLWVCGKSMQPIFNEGDLIIIDPDEAPRPGDYVVAKNGSKEATFKKYRPRGIDENGQDVFELVPLNDDFPTLHSDRQHIEIIGVMVEHRIFRKR